MSEVNHVHENICPQGYRAPSQSSTKTTQPTVNKYLDPNLSFDRNGSNNFIFPKTITYSPQYVCLKPFPSQKNDSCASRTLQVMTLALLHLKTEPNRSDNKTKKLALSIINDAEKVYEGHKKKLGLFGRIRMNILGLFKDNDWKKVKREKKMLDMSKKFFSLPPIPKKSPDKSKTVRRGLTQTTSS